MIESVTIKRGTGSSKLKKNGETTSNGFRKSGLAFENKFAIISLRNRVFFFRNSRINLELRILT